MIAAQKIVVAEMMRTTQHRAHAAHLKHQPLQNLEALARAGEQKLAGLRGQVKQNSARFKKRYRLAVRPIGINDGGDFVVRADL